MSCLSLPAALWSNYCVYRRRGWNVTSEKNSPKVTEPLSKHRYSTPESSDAIPRAHGLHALASQVSRVIFIPGTIIHTMVIVPTSHPGQTLIIKVTVRQAGPRTLCRSACTWTDVSLSNKVQSDYGSATWLSHVQLCDPMDCSPPGSSVRGILQASSWSGLSLPSPGDLPAPGIKPRSALQADTLPSEPPRDWKYL